jgi:hypothetical protein
VAVGVMTNDIKRDYELCGAIDHIASRVKQRGGAKSMIGVVCFDVLLESCRIIRTRWPIPLPISQDHSSLTPVLPFQPPSSPQSHYHRRLNSSHPSVPTAPQADPYHPPERQKG